jgi:prevent-host-death family protein
MAAATTVGIRELKAQLSHHLKRVRSGARITVTERGRPVATITPVEASADLEWAHRLVSEGKAAWRGGKPAGNPHPARVKDRSSVSDAVLEDRG